MNMEIEMPRLKLIYFDFNGGRGESNRLAMAIGNIPFEDERVPAKEWPSVKESTPFHQLPVLEIDGVRITQTNSINRYVGKLAGLYPDDPLEALRCDEVMAAVEDITKEVTSTFGIKDEEEKRKAREKLTAGPISLYVKRLGEKLEAQGGEYFADGRLTVADLRVFLWVRHLRSGALDYIPKDLPDRLAPNLVEHFERVNAHPAIVAWYAAH